MCLRLQNAPLNPSSSYGLPLAFRGLTSDHFGGCLILPHYHFHRLVELSILGEQVGGFAQEP
jgi:hypothetical protein